MDKESDQITFDTLEKLTGFPAQIIKNELLGDIDQDLSSIDLNKLRQLMAKFIDRELLSTED